jgi:hypothetical protein
MTKTKAVRHPLSDSEREELRTLLLLDDRDGDRLPELLVQLPRGVTPQDFLVGSADHQWSPEAEQCHSWTVNK